VRPSEPSRGAAVGVEPSQRWMADAIRRPETLLDDPSMRAACDEIVADDGRLSPVEQLEIYREQFFFRHIDALVEDFPGVRHLVGAERFHDLAVEYLGAHPPTSFTLRDLGDRFPTFLRAHRAIDAHAIVCDMADVEWAFVEVFDAAGAERLDAARLATVPADAWANVALVLHPTLRLVRLDHPVHRMREAILAGEDPPLPEARPVHLALFRDELQIRYDELDPACFALVEELGRGTPLGAACDAIASRFFPDDPAAVGARLEAWFARLMALGLIVDLRLG
jgi:hypothetical protein